MTYPTHSPNRLPLLSHVAVLSPPSRTTCYPADDLLLSSSWPPRLRRPADVAARWLRQPRLGTHSQGFGSSEVNESE